jgi:hypothetical protein
LKLEALYYGPLNDLKRASRRVVYNSVLVVVEPPSAYRSEVKNDFEKYRSDIKEDISKVFSRYVPKYAD